MYDLVHEWSNNYLHIQFFSDRSMKVFSAKDMNNVGSWYFMMEGHNVMIKIKRAQPDHPAKWDKLTSAMSGGSSTEFVKALRHAEHMIKEWEKFEKEFER